MNQVCLQWQFPANVYVANLFSTDRVLPVIKKGDHIVIPNEDSIFGPVNQDFVTELHAAIAARLFGIRDADLSIIDRVEYEGQCIRIFNRGNDWKPALMRRVECALQEIPGHTFTFTS